MRIPHADPVAVGQRQNRPGEAALVVLDDPLRGVVRQALALGINALALHLGAEHRVQ
ncbi:MAG: hypothetical protein M3237_14225 [Actinomycetota bacterium]|nr:hypothetical protein [Actinomycetota bacterium]